MTPGTDHGEEAIGDEIGILFILLGPGMSTLAWVKTGGYRPIMVITGAMILGSIHGLTILPTYHGGDPGEELTGKEDTGQTHTSVEDAITVKMLG